MVPSTSLSPAIRSLIFILSISAGAGIYYYLSQNSDTQNENTQPMPCSCPTKDGKETTLEETPEPNALEQTESVQEVMPLTSSPAVDKKDTKPCTPNLGFTSVEQQPTPCHLKIHGTIPKWIEGDFLAIGPGIFEIQGNKAYHWLDGLAMIHNFSFHHGTITYNSRLINSNYSKECFNKGKISGSTPEKKQSTWAKLSSAFSSSERVPYDNTNVNVIPYRNTYVTLTESPHHLTIEPKSLKTLHPFFYADKIEAQFASAHPHFDPATKYWYGVLVNYAHNSDYLIYRRAENSNKREIVATIPVGYPAYIHTFTVTKNYFIITEAPFNVSPYDLLMTDKAYIETFSWKPKTGTQFIVINRANGNLVGKFKTEAFFTLHHINAFEKNNEIMIDLIAYNDPAIISAFNLENICSSNPKVPISEFRRYTVNLITKNVSMKIFAPDSGEMPNINDAYRTKEYHYLYCNMSNKPGTLADQICKIDLKNGQKLLWQSPGTYPNEPVFVPTPHQHSEDDGVVISHVLDAAKKQTFILILDAKNLQELARASICGYIPFTVHSKFILEIPRTRL